MSYIQFDNNEGVIRIFCLTFIRKNVITKRKRGRVRVTGTNFSWFSYYFVEPKTKGDIMGAPKQTVPRDTKRKITSFDVANYFLSQADEDAGDLISNLKLQKLLYYAQGYHIALKDKPLFPEKIEAWTHGPVVPEVYHKYKEFDGNPIPLPKGFDFSIFDEETRKVLDEVYRVFGQFSAWKLRQMAHNEPPWANAVETEDREITHEALKEYFSTLIWRARRKKPATKRAPKSSHIAQKVPRPIKNPQSSRFIIWRTDLALRTA